VIQFFRALTAFLKIATRLLEIYEPMLKERAAKKRFYEDIDKAATALGGDGDDIAGEFVRTELELLSKGIIRPEDIDSGKE